MTSGRELEETGKDIMRLKVADLLAPKDRLSPPIKTQSERFSPRIILTRYLTLLFIAAFV